MKNRTYRYFEGTPLYPFGYGLTYGDCKPLSMEVTKAGGDAFDGVTVTVKVKNDGNILTQDVLQVYIKDEESPCAVKNYSLCGFSRVTLDAGEEKTVEIKVEKRAFTVVDDNGNRDVCSSEFTLFAGFHQPDERSCKLTGTDTLKASVKI
jgi:beta-glucosidase